MVVSMLAEREQQYQARRAMSQVSLTGEERPVSPDGDVEMGMEESSADAAPTQLDDDPTEYGMTMAGICQWYLGEIEESLQSEEDYDNELKLIKKIVKRMVRKDHLLLPLNVMSEQQMEALHDYQEVALRDDTILILHPSLDVDAIAEI
jgi:hypothetical protein